MTDWSRGMLAQVPPGMLHQMSARGIRNAYHGIPGLSQEATFNQLRLEAALSGVDSSILGNYIRSQNTMHPASSMIDPFLAQAAAARAAGSDAMSFYRPNISARTNEPLSGLLGSGSVHAVPSASDLHDGGPSSTRGSSKKHAKKKRANSKIDISYTEYDPGDTRALSLPSDEGNLSAYQCLLRQQILLFAVQMSDIQCSAQGRNKPITLGQVGVLCRHCAKIPPGLRPCGAVYFPGKLSGLYQASQNMAINHFSKSCQSIPEDARQRLIQLKEQKSSVLGGGKHFWANGARVAGVYEAEEGLLRFKMEQPKKSPPSAQVKEDDAEKQFKGVPANEIDNAATEEQVGRNINKEEEQTE